MRVTESENNLSMFFSLRALRRCWRSSRAGPMLVTTLRDLVVPMRALVAMRSDGACAERDLCELLFRPTAIISASKPHFVPPDTEGLSPR